MNHHLDAHRHYVLRLAILHIRHEFGGFVSGLSPTPTPTPTRPAARLGLALDGSLPQQVAGSGLRAFRLRTDDEQFGVDGGSFWIARQQGSVEVGEHHR
jgi:hypothetical protein